MRDVNIVIVFKNKGDRGECQQLSRHLTPQHHWKTLWSRSLEDFPSVCSETLSRVTFVFRAKRSTIDMIFSIG